MPTIEIVSLERKNLINITKDKYPFKVWQNTKLISHRHLFIDYLSNKEGVILHLANQECVKTGFWFASDLYDHDFEELNPNNVGRFKFRNEFVEGVKDLLLRAWNLSPVKVAYLLTDYQFGGDSKGFLNLESVEELWLLHNKQGLEWNKLYEIG